MNPFDSFTPEPWTSESLCATHPHPDLWFAGDGHPTTAGPRTTEAINFCNTVCNVRDDCLQYALANNETWGVWGGMTETQRRQLTVVAA